MRLLFFSPHHSTVAVFSVRQKMSLPLLPLQACLGYSEARVVGRSRPGFNLEHLAFLAVLTLGKPP